MTLKASAEKGASSSGRRADLVAVGLDAHDGRHVERRRQVVDDGVQQRLDAFVLEGGAAEHRRDADVERRLADHLAQVRGGDLPALEIRLEQVVVVLGDATR